MKRVMFGLSMALLATPVLGQSNRIVSDHGMSARGGHIILKVAENPGARSRVTAAAGKEDAQILDARTIVNEKGRSHGWLRLRVSADRAQSLLDSIRSIGKLYSESAGTVENASEYEQLERRIARIREHQTRLDGILKGPRKLRGSDILYVQERLFRAGIDEGELLQRRLDLERAAQTSIITVTLFEPGATAYLHDEKVNLAAGFSRGIGSAWLAFQQACSRAVTASAYMIVFAPIWIPALALMVFLLRILIPFVRRQSESLHASLHEILLSRRSMGPKQPRP